MQPGDVITCPSCGASSLPLHTTGGRWPSQGSSALIVTWTHGAYPRHDTANVHGHRGCCLWCSDKLPGGIFPEGRTSVAGEGPLNEGQSRTSGTSLVGPGAAHGNKAPLERPTWCLDEPGPVPSWLKGYGGTSRAYLEKRYGPGAHFQRNGGVSDDTAIGAALPLASRDALHALELPERFLELARAYRDETGRWPYGYELALVPPGDVIDATNAPWITWCRARNAAAAPKPPPAQPKGQMGLRL